MDILAGPFTGNFLIIAGFIIGVGAVTVIDWHGFLGRTSEYWTEATVRTHKITKPLIWLGTGLYSAGLLLLVFGLGGMGGAFGTGTKTEGGINPFMHEFGAFTYLVIMLCILPILVANGLFLTFVISPMLIKLEKEGRAAEILPQKIQLQITASFIVSFVGWWGSVVCYLLWLTGT